ncbi:hypothetical protein MMC34_001823 [Xylographa carneopallida]|nr:hypothetical protein [Xylographa carneopallida]
MSKQTSHQPSTITGTKAPNATPIQSPSSPAPSGRMASSRLTAIAGAIHNLHVMHAFTNGCGRVNIFLLLPKMLLAYGFGLPPGGEYGSGIPKTVLHMLFNGGYSLDETARFLWVTQDFGLMSRARHQATCLGDEAD